MEIFKHSPFKDVYVPYIVQPDRLHPETRMRIIWESLASTHLPALTRWIIVQALGRPNRLLF